MISITSPSDIQTVFFIRKLLMNYFFFQIQAIGDSKQCHKRIDNHSIYKALKHQSFDTQSQYSNTKCKDYRTIQLSFLGNFIVGISLFFIGFIRDSVEIAIEKQSSDKSQYAIF
ncbi:MAG: hypothetical protein WCL18_07160 [bacterium]